MVGFLIAGHLMKTLYVYATSLKKKIHKNIL